MKRKTLDFEDNHIKQVDEIIKKKKTKYSSFSQFVRIAVENLINSETQKAERENSHVTN